MYYYQAILYHIRVFFPDTSHDIRFVIAPKIYFYKMSTKPMPPIGLTSMKERGQIEPHIILVTPPYRLLIPTRFIKSCDLIYLLSFKVKCNARSAIFFFKVKVGQKYYIHI